MKNFTNFVKRLALASLLLSCMGAVMANPADTRVLVLIDTDTGGTYQLAKSVAQGVESDGLATAAIKLTAPSNLPALKGVPVASPSELSGYDGIAFGSPVYFGNISTGMSAFLARTIDQWKAHALEGMPAMTFNAAGSGAGNELAAQALWASLASHGMVLVSNGIRGMSEVDNRSPQGMTILGAGSLASAPPTPQPSPSEVHIAIEQGRHFAKVAKALKGTWGTTPPAPASADHSASAPLSAAHSSAKQIALPPPPQPVGNYVPFVRSGNLIYINQVALENGAIRHPGKVGVDLSEAQAQEATRITMLNVLAVLNDALGGDLNRVTRVVQLTGFFNTPDDYANHAGLMNPASNLAVEVFGEQGKHARATVGASSLPLKSAVEIQAVFEVN